MSKENLRDENIRLRQETELLKQDVANLRSMLHLSEDLRGLAERENEKLEGQVRIAHAYIRHAYWEDPAIESILEIPACLKPLDSIKYASTRS